MSLKHFHIVFIVFAVLCDSGFWLWTRLLPDVAAALGVAHLGLFAGWLSIGLTLYGLWYLLKKSRTIIV